MNDPNMATPKHPNVLHLLRVEEHRFRQTNAFLITDCPFEQSKTVYSHNDTYLLQNVFRVLTSLTVGEKNELLSFLVFFYRNHCYFNIGMLCSGSKHLYEKLIIFVGVSNFHQKFLCVPAQSTSDFHYHLI